MSRVLFWVEAGGATQQTVHSSGAISTGTHDTGKLDIVNWIEGLYNNRRIHSSIGYKTPMDWESGFMTA
jgi:hypothetical protein